MYLGVFDSTQVTIWLNWKRDKVRPNVDGIHVTLALRRQVMASMLTPVFKKKIFFLHVFLDSL